MESAKGQAEPSTLMRMEPEVNRLFHTSKGIPENLRIPPGLYLSYSPKVRLESHYEGTQPLPFRVPLDAEVIEVETTRDLVPIRWILQVPFTPERDLVLNVRASGRVDSAWTPKRNRLPLVPIGDTRYTALSEYLKQIAEVVPPETQSDYLRLAQHEFGLDHEPEERADTETPPEGANA